MLFSKQFDFLLVNFECFLIEAYSVKEKLKSMKIWWTSVIKTYYLVINSFILFKLFYIFATIDFFV